MSLALLIDFGSTYTKVTAVDLETDRSIGRAQAPSTVDTDVLQGLLRAMELLKAQVNLDNVSLKLASSSAAGGLRMVAVGLIARLTSEAANRAALGAGAKVIDVFDRALNQRKIRHLEEINPDIILLAGGVDGGNRDVILQNAQQIASSKVKAPVVVAGNVDVSDEVDQILRQGGHQTYICQNVMPEMNTLNVDPAREMIREVFVKHIVEAKGLERAVDYVGNLVMPTPMAVLRITDLLATGTDTEPGIGDTMVVDVGGATTDIHTAARGMPVEAEVRMMGLDEPFAKRTVEGDLGLRVSARSLIDAVSRSIMPRNIRMALESNEALLRMEYLTANTSTLPHVSDEWEMDTKMAAAASFIAAERHAGRLETARTDFGTTVMVQRGKDLTQVGTLIGTGGVIAFGRSPEIIMAECLFDRNDPFSLRPKRPQLMVDAGYMMYAGGLLSTVYPDKAIRLVKSSLRPAEAPKEYLVTGDA